MSLQIKRKTAGDWNTVNPLLKEGELDYEIGTGKFKIGDGSSY
jgi:hypothetical protein